MLKLITPNTEHIDPHAEPPWHRSEFDYDIQDRVRFYLPENVPGKSVKLEWAEDHANLYDENKEDNDLLFVYTDGSLSFDEWICRTGYGVAIYREATEIASENRPLSKFAEAYNAEMKALEAALIMIHNLIVNDNSPPSKIIISTDNTGAIQQPRDRPNDLAHFSQTHPGPTRPI